VNLVDLVDIQGSKEAITPKRFPTELALGEYTIKTGKIFPKASAYAGGLLKHLLRRIGSPGKRRSGKRRGGRRRERRPKG
jgi:hypothetical protein